MKIKPSNKQIKQSIKFLKQFMNLNRNQQMEVIKNIEKRIKEE